MTPHLDRHSTTDPKPEMLSTVYSGNRIEHDERNLCGIEHAQMFRKDENVCGIVHAHVFRKEHISRQRQLNHSGGGRKCI